MRIVTVGIDPGISGAIAVINNYGAEVWAENFHTTKIGTQVHLNYSEIDRMLCSKIPFGMGCYDEMHIFIERVHSMPGQGLASTFTFGTAFGGLVALATASGNPITLVTPSAWKKTVGIRGSNKEDSRGRAMQLFPDVDLKYKKDHGRAEALLIAYHGMRTLTRSEK